MAKERKEWKDRTQPIFYRSRKDPSPPDGLHVITGDDIDRGVWIDRVEGDIDRIFKSAESGEKQLLFAGDASSFIADVRGALGGCTAEQFPLVSRSLYWAFRVGFAYAAMAVTGQSEDGARILQASHASLKQANESRWGHTPEKEREITARIAELEQKEPPLRVGEIDQAIADEFGFKSCRQAARYRKKTKKQK